MKKRIIAIALTLALTAAMAVPARRPPLQRIPIPNPVPPP